LEAQMLFKQTTPWQQTEPPSALVVKSSPFEFAKLPLFIVAA